MANNSLDLISLDPNTLKADFKNWLLENEQFKDFDYESTNMGFLLELFAYNTYKNAFFTNMGISEAFLDSAQLRSSILSHAKHLNYLPTSYRSARARVKLSFTASGETAPYTIAKGSPLTAIIKNDSYTFTFAENIVVASPNTSYSIEADIYEGIYLTDTYTFDTSLITKTFPITNKNVDIDSLSVTVFEDGNEIGDLYTFSPTLLGINDKSKVFFIQPSMNNSYEVIFGDNNIGRRPKLNSTVVLSYRVSSGIDGNGAKSFSVDFDPTSTDELTSTPLVTTLQVSRGGTAEETIESIKFMAPRHFQTQERAVTPTDYSIILRKEFPEINDIFAYGGEELEPPENGKVFISLDLDEINGIPDSKKKQYSEFLKNRKTFGTRVFFIEPEYSYIEVNSKVRFNSNITSLSPGSIKSIIQNEIISFRDENLDKFDAILRHSKLETAIDSADTSIISSFSEFYLYKKLAVSLNETNNIDVFFGAEVFNPGIEIPKNHGGQFPQSCWSNEFYYNNQLCRIEDNGNGKMVLVKLVGNRNEFIQNVGEIEYSSGSVLIRNLLINSLVETNFRLYINPLDKDFRSYRNNILTIEPESIKIALEELRL